MLRAAPAGLTNLCKISSLYAFDDSYHFHDDDDLKVGNYIIILESLQTEETKNQITLYLSLNS